MSKHNLADDLADDFYDYESEVKSNNEGLTVKKRQKIDQIYRSTLEQAEYLHAMRLACNTKLSVLELDDLFIPRIITYSDLKFSKMLY